MSLFFKGGQFSAYSGELCCKGNPEYSRSHPAVELDSRLGWEPSMEYVCDKWHLEWKVRQVNSALREIEIYRKMLELYAV